MKIHRTLIVVTVGGCTLMTQTANAQTTSAQQDEGIGVLQEVVVTAQKRSETILSVPISITALSQESLEHQGIKDINDIARATPSLNIGANNGFGYSNVSIRGVASTTGAATTGIYIDDSPIEQRIDSLTPPLD
jgi:iron complex outermembrane receptor protein